MPKNLGAEHGKEVKPKPDFGLQVSEATVYTVPNTYSPQFFSNGTPG